MTELILTNARLVLPNAVLSGTLVARDGLIVAIDERPSRLPAAVDCEGDWLIPGLVELHTDHLEACFLPRPKVRWDMTAAVQAHDAQVAASGITTVLDALRVGMDEDAAVDAATSRALGDAIDAAQREGRLRAEHHIHLRCEVSSPDAVEGFALFDGDPLLRLVSLMDHTPGQRQFVSLEAYRIYQQGKSGMSDAEFDAFLTRRLALAGRHAPGNRAAIAAAAAECGVPLASHDDATEAHVAEAVEQGVRLAEFPTTTAAADAARRLGLAVVMGAPNVVRGGSHSGNVAAQALAEAGALDILSSDYVPASLLHAAFLLADRIEPLGLPAAVATVSHAPSCAVGFDDRGELAEGRRADLVRVRREAGAVPAVGTVWRKGVRVC